MTLVSDRRAADVVSGDVVDAARGDLGRYLTDADRIYAECEYWRVEDVERETVDCVRIDFDHESYGLRPDDIVRVVVDPEVIGAET